MPLQLVRCYRKLSEAFAADFQMNEARRAADRGIELAERLLKQQPTWPQLERELAKLLYGRAERFINSGKLSEAEAVLAEPSAQFADRLELMPDDPHEDLVLGAELANLRATLLFRQGRFDEAIQAARSAVSLRMIALPNHFDAKPLLEQNAALLETVGQILLAQGKLESAVEEFRNALRLSKQRLGGRSPMEINLAVFSKEPWRRYTEPLAVADYCSTQLRLAAILPSLGRPMRPSACWAKQSKQPRSRAIPSHLTSSLASCMQTLQRPSDSTSPAAARPNPNTSCSLPPRCGTR